MSEGKVFTDEFEASDGSILRDTLAVINSLETEGVIGKYAIGGAMALLFYVEPILTDDLDIFCYVPQAGLLEDLSPIYRHLTASGYKPEGECITIEGVAVQFLIPPTKLVAEALDNATETVVESVPTRVFQYEYLLAIMTETGRPKDRAKIASALESLKPDMSKLNDLLKRYNLSNKWSALSS
jgi:hypothetical protein